MKRLVVLLALVVFVPTVAFAAPGALDSTYSGDGATSNTFGSGDHVVLDSQGRYVVGGQVFPERLDAGRPSVMRYRPNGSLDPTLDADGRMSLPVMGSVQALGLQNGRITVATERALWRLTASGQPDTTFGGDGRIDIPLGYVVDGAHPMWTTGSKVFLLTTDAETGEAVLWRFAADGTASGGVYCPNLKQGVSVALHQGWVYVVGEVQDVNAAPRVGVERFASSTFAIDRNFSGGRTVALGPDNIYDEYGLVTEYTPEDIAVNPVSGRFAVVGRKYDCSQGDCSSYYYGFALMFSASGNLDTGWGFGGEARALCANVFGANAVMFQGTKLLVGGSGYNKWDFDFVFSLERLTAAGGRDSTWSRSAVCPAQTSPTVGADLADMLLSGGKVLAVGGRFTARYMTS